MRIGRKQPIVRTFPCFFGAGCFLSRKHGAAMVNLQITWGVIGRSGRAAVLLSLQAEVSLHVSGTSAGRDPAPGESAGHLRSTAVLLSSEEVLRCRKSK